MAEPAPDRLLVAVAQLNPRVGDFAGNFAKAKAAYAFACDKFARILVLPELYVSGYPAQDMVNREDFLKASLACVEKLAALTVKPGSPTILVGAPRHDPEYGVFNSVFLLAQGRIVTWRDKSHLPNNSVFDEKRNYVAADLQSPVLIDQIRIGVPICEDLWWDDCIECLAESGAELLICINGSPYERGKDEQRLQVLAQRIAENHLPILYLNRVGGQDDLVFDGDSFALNSDYSLPFRMPCFQECTELVLFHRTQDGWRCTPGRQSPIIDEDEKVWRALCSGLRDYVNDSGFKEVVLGMSGGIDSALVCAIACDALGPENVHAIMMPHYFTSVESLLDAQTCAERAGASYQTMQISEAVEGLERTLNPLFGSLPRDTTEENLQARVRGVLLMAISNKFGRLLLSTGNKSELAVGYATLYGDMNGAFNPIKDLYKSEVFHLAQWRNMHFLSDLHGRRGEVIPTAILEKPPSAELAPDQKDQDSLPPYDVLDAILAGLIDSDMSIADMMKRGFDEELLNRIWQMINRSEFKRRQSCPGVRVTNMMFGPERRFPISNHF